MIRHEDDWLLGNCSVLVGRQNGVTALDLLDGSGFTRRPFALDDLHECARFEAVELEKPTSLVSWFWYDWFLFRLSLFLTMIIFSIFLFMLTGVAMAFRQVTGDARCALLIISRRGS